MADTTSFMPLSAIEAVVFDTETTGLDARKARMVQIGAIAITSGAIGIGQDFDQLINPGQTIPSQSTAIHGIADADVVAKPTFKTAFEKFQTFCDGRLLLGHSIFYDFEVFREECRIAGLSWKKPRSLDIRNLARVAAPSLVDHSLDRLCEWLGVSILGRHTATGDARATAEAFIKLVPLLRERGIRTVAEAEAVCRNLVELDARLAGGLMAVDQPHSEVPAELVKLDVFAFRHTVKDVMSAPPALLPGTVSLRDLIKHLLDAGLSSVFVNLENGRFGIVTERDALRALKDYDAAGLELPISTITKYPLHTVASDDHVYKAIGRMERLKIRHLAVVDDDGDIVGALTPRNLLRNRATTVIAIGDRIAAAETSEQLGACWAEIPSMVHNLLREDVNARNIAAIISSEICGITRRAAELAEALMLTSGRGAPPVSYTVLVLGSAGRGESLLAADQDNAIVFEHGEAGGEIDEWFADMATHLARILDEAGIVYCKGDVMAKSPEWRHSLDGWTATIEAWVRRQNPQDLLNVDIFFDAVPVYGDLSLGKMLLQRAFNRARSAPDFLKMLTELARQWQTPVGLLGGFQKVDGRLDLKKFGLMPIFTAARVLALRHGVDARSTAGRLHGVLAREIGSADNINSALAAHELMMRTVLEQQLADGKVGIPLSPRILVDRLDKAKKRQLKTSFDAVAEVIDLVAEGRLV